MNKILAEISVGELLDKISILEIKKDKIKDANNLKFINEEYVILKNQFEKNVKIDEKLNKLFESLKEINSKLWLIEDEKRYVKKIRILVKNLLKFQETFTSLTITELK